MIPLRAQTDIGGAEHRENAGSVNSQILSFFSGDGRRCVVVLKAFFDESGTHKGAKILCVAGCFGTHKQWSGFQEEWGRWLSTWGEGLRFHAKDPNCDTHRLFLVDIMKKHRLSTVVCSVDPNLFQDNTGDHFRTTVGNAYSACAYGCALEICRNAKKYGVGPVSLVLESGQPNVGCVEKVLMELIGDPEFDISLVSVVKKEDFIQLHVPDFISHICSTKDPWFQCLEDSDDVLHIPISASILEKTSRDIKLLVENNKAKRRRIKRMEKSGQ